METCYFIKKIEKDFDYYLTNDGYLVRQTPVNPTLDLSKIKHFKSEEDAYEYIRTHSSIKGFLTIVKVYIK